MTRLMGDAMHSNVARLPAGLQLVGGYVTGSADILWTPADWARFPFTPHITIDQGFGPAVLGAIVRDVEPGAWPPQEAVNRTSWTAARPTIYCDQWDLTRAGGVLACGWRGDLWLAIPGWHPGQALPPTPGCTVVAVQNEQNVGSAYDLSVVLDDTWPYPPPAPVPPKGHDMIILQVTAPAGNAWEGTRTYLYAPGAAPQHIVSVPDNQAFEKVLQVVPVSWEQFTGLGGV